MDTIFKPIKDISRSQNVFNEIKDAILSGKFAAGAHLVESQLAKNFSVSQITIREALMHLAQTGLVIREHHKGTKVTELSESEIIERLSVRYKLEELACIEASKNMSDEEFALLDRRLLDLNAAMKGSLYFERTSADLDFHRYIWKMAKNGVLYHSLEQLCIPLFAYLGIRRSRVGEPGHNFIFPHEKYVEALKCGDEEKILNVVRNDTKVSYQGYLAKP